VPKSELLNFLFHTDTQIPDITNIDPHIPLLPINETRLENHRHKLVKNKTGLYVLIDQTGRVYKVNNETKNALEFVRYDSTYYWGYNGSSIDFSYNDTLFSFGGDGFWRINGQLRYYSNVFHEWNISPISEEIPTYDYINYLSRKSSSIFYIQKPFDDAVTGKNLYEWRALRLNLNTKDNTILGQFSSPLLDILKNNTPIIKINLPSLDGILVFFTFENILLLKFNDNTVYKLNNHSIKDLILGNSNSIQIRNTFEVGDSVYYTLSNDSSNKLNSFKISMNDFTKEPFPVYDQLPVSKYSTSVFTAIVLIIVLFVVWFSFKKRKKTEIYSLSESTTVVNENQNEFSIIEKKLIEQIIYHNEKGSYLSGDQLNNILGVSKKRLETQKKVRGDTFNRINYKFKTLFEVEVDCIERIRSESDRRFYNYKINKENAALYKERYKN
jgi:hypothetical protein